MTHYTGQPDIIGCCIIDGEPRFYAITRKELDRSAVILTRILASFDFGVEKYILTVSMTPEVAYFAPFEQAVQMSGNFGINAEDSPYDAGRVESISRQFNPPAMCGISKSVLDGLRMFGHDPATVFRGRVIWARPDAYDAVNAMPDVDARRCILGGPALFLECMHGGLHYDAREWAIEDGNATLMLSSRFPRTEPVANVRLGFSGSTSTKPCGCGNPDPIIVLR
jgi:hypothetical protein